MSMMILHWLKEKDGWSSYMDKILLFMYDDYSEEKEYDGHVPASSYY